MVEILAIFVNKIFKKCPRRPDLSILAALICHAVELIPKDWFSKATAGSTIASVVAGGSAAVINTILSTDQRTRTAMHDATNTTTELTRLLNEIEVHGERPITDAKAVQELKKHLKEAKDQLKKAFDALKELHFC